MRYLSLFSGIEACTVAWHRLGWEPVAFAEIEPGPCKILAEKYPGVPNLGDVTRITDDDVAALGPFDLDPCAPVDRPWDTAATHYTIHDDGLAKPWHGRVWLNPPYGRDTEPWLARLADHGNGIALIFARTETGMFVRQVWLGADAVLFIEGRLHFHFPDGRRSPTNSGAPSVLVAYGQDNAHRLALARGPMKPRVQGQYFAGWRQDR